MIGSNRTVWVPKGLKSLKSIMKPNDLHLILNPISNLVKLFDVEGKLLRQETITCGMGSRGDRYPGKVWQLTLFGNTDLATNDPNRRIVWMALDQPYGKNNPAMDRWFFVAPNFAAWEIDQMMHCHFWVLPMAGFVAIYDLIYKTIAFKGGIVFAELGAYPMIDNDGTAPQFAATYKR
jgi:hypothetical protein